jgi:hypothetical protein
MSTIDLDQFVEAKYFSVSGSPPDPGGMVLEISRVEKKDFNDGPKLALGFRGEARQLILSATNLKFLAATLGKNPDSWIGQQVALSIGRSPYGSPMLKVTVPQIGTNSTANRLATEQVQ